MATGNSKPKAKGAAALALFNAVIAGIKSNVTSTKPVTFDNVTTTWAAVTAIFQAYVDKAAASASAKLNLAHAVAAAKTAEVAAKAELKLFKMWAVSQYGKAAYIMFGLPQPKVPTTSAVKKAIGVSKRRGKAAAKKTALAAIAPHDEEATALAAISGAVGSSTTSAPVAAPPAAAPGLGAPVTPAHA